MRDMKNGSPQSRLSRKRVRFAPTLSALIIVTLLGVPSFLAAMPTSRACAQVAPPKKLPSQAPFDPTLREPARRSLGVHAASMLNAEQVRTCAWIHMWPGETREKVLLVLNDLINATEAESRTDAEKIEAQSEQLAGPAAKADRVATAFAHAELLREAAQLSDRILSFESTKLAQALTVEGVGEEDVAEVTQSLGSFRRSVLGQQQQHLIGGGGRYEIRHALRSFCEETAEVAQQESMRELAAEVLLPIEELFVARLQALRRSTPRGVVLFAQMAAARGDPDQAEHCAELDRERNRGLRSIAAVERRIAEANLTALDRFVDLSNDARGRQLRDATLFSMYRVLGVDPWDPRPLLPATPANSESLGVGSDGESATRLVLEALVTDQQLTRDQMHRMALSAVERHWQEFRETMSSTARIRDKVLKALHSWHARSNCVSEQVVAILERDATPDTRAAIDARINAWRAKANALEQEQRDVFESFKPRVRVIE